MSSIAKKMLIRSTSDIYAQRVLVKHKYVHHNQIDSLRVNRRPSVHVSRSSCRVWHTRRQELNISANGFPHLTPKKREQSIGSRLRAKAILTPVTDPTPTTKKRVFTFGKGKSEGNKGMKSLLGGKGANLAEMASIGLSVPPGLTISTEACQEYQNNGKKLPDGLWEQILDGLESVEKDMGAFLGDPSKPLLLSVRSGAAISMPGMMDTVLNLGLNDEVVAGLAAKSGERFAYDSYRRFLDMFGDVVMGIPHSLFEEKLENLKHAKGSTLDTELSASDLKELVEQYKNVYLEAKSEKFPSDPKKQLQLAVNAVFDSWDSPRAIKYRSINQITGLKGTAVNIQCMVFGNMGNTSGTGVLFTRNPSTGENKLYGEFLVNAQGEDVVAGIRTPEDLDTMKSCMPEAYKELVENCEILERHYKDMMDIEFTVQENRLWMLQCRAGKRTGKGAVKIAVDMVNEGLVDTPTAIKMVEPQHLDQLLHPQFFASDERIKAVRKMIMAVTLGQRKAALDLLLPYQRTDFEGIFRAMDGLPVTIRLLDPPLHEFLPEGDLDQIVGELTTDTGMTEDEVYARIEKLSEVNPMLGFRGCRLGISYPELTEMQVRAIFQAAVSMMNQGVTVFPEIMVPLVGTPQELGHQVSLIRSIAKKVFSEMGSSLSFKVGTMIEIPRAALVADEIAKEAEFFSFGTNDLTQMTFGYSRDDVGKFLPIYLSKGILQHDPFEVIDRRGVGQLIKIATEKGRRARPSLKVGICGEHGGEPSSVAFFAEAGLDYVSCSPFRVPIARLAAAQVAV